MNEAVFFCKLSSGLFEVTGDVKRAFGGAFYSGHLSFDTMQCSAQPFQRPNRPRGQWLEIQIR